MSIPYLIIAFLILSAVLWVLVAVVELRKYKRRKRVAVSYEKRREPPV